MNLRLCDLHNDAVTVLSLARFEKYIKRAEKAGVREILVSIWTTEIQEPLGRILCYRNMLETLDTRVKLLMHIEDAWFLTTENIDEFVGLAPYSVGLTWNDRNALAGGAGSSDGLTSLGRVVIEKLVASGIHVDLAHLNERSFFEVAEVLKKSGQRLLCTHTCFDEVNPHPRNLDRRQIQTIVDSGGLVGLTLVRDFLTLRSCATMHDVYAHIKYFLDNFGQDNLAIGTDFFGTKNLPKDLRKYKNFKRLKKYLLRKSISEATIDRIFHMNWYDFQRVNEQG